MLFTNVIMVDSRQDDFGCHVCQYFVGCLLNVDDVTVLLLSVSSLLTLLACCLLCETYRKLGFSFNCEKSYCISFVNIAQIFTWSYLAWNSLYTLNCAICLPSSRYAFRKNVIVLY
jgi:hypothetical protein